MKISSSRVVAFVVTPLLTLAAGTAATLGAKYGLKVNQTAFTADGLAVASAAAGACLKWLHGLSLWERAERAAQNAIEEAKAWTGPTAVVDAERAVEEAAPKVIEKVEEEVGAPADAFPPAPEQAPVEPAPPVA